MRSFFGSKDDIERRYERLFRSPEFARLMAPGADERREAARIASRKTRAARKPSMRSALAMASKAGVVVSGATIKSDGSIELIFGQPSSGTEPANVWDTVLHAKN